MTARKRSWLSFSAFSARLRSVTSRTRPTDICLPPCWNGRIRIDRELGFIPAPMPTVENDGLAGPDPVREPSNFMERQLGVESIGLRPMSSSRE